MYYYKYRTCNMKLKIKVNGNALNYCVLISNIIIDLYSNFIRRIDNVNLMQTYFLFLLNGFKISYLFKYLILC